MSDVLVLGGGICGLATAMLLARDGREVTVLERDGEAPPDTVDRAWDEWRRKGVAQFNQGHYYHARFRQMLDDNLPDVRDRLAAAGGACFNPVAMLPPAITDRDPRPEDDRFRVLTARRPVAEWAFARAAEDEPRLTVRRGVGAAAPLLGTSAVDGVPHVSGVRTDDGEELRADLVVDATGRRTPLPRWVRETGGRPPVEESQDCRFFYLGRHFRGTPPEVRGGLLGEYGTISVLTLPADASTWAVVIFTVAGDPIIPALRDQSVWSKVVASCPLQAHWLDGEPLEDGIETMSGVLDTYRRYVVDGAPVVTGIVPVADAWASTNPSLGRGVSLGVWHAARLRDHVRTASGDPVAFATGWDELTEAEIAPWYHAQLQMDRARTAAMEGIREGRVPAPPAADDVAAQMGRAFTTAAMLDGDVYRGLVEVMSCLATPEEILGRDGMFEKVIAAGQGTPPPVPGPSREDLLRITA